MIVLVFVEGLTELVFYRILLSKLINARKESKEYIKSKYVKLIDYIESFKKADTVFLRANNTLVYNNQL